MRPKAALALMIAPVVLGVGLLTATAGWWFTVQSEDGQAQGRAARLRFESACAAEARPVLQKRLEELGLAPVAEGTLDFVVKTPGMPDDLEHLPKALARPGTLEVRAAGQAQPVKVANVGVQLAFSGTPLTLVMLETAVPDEEKVDVAIDGEPVELESPAGLEIQAAARAEDSRKALRLATDRAVALRHPLPCPVTPLGAEWVEP